MYDLLSSSSFDFARVKRRIFSTMKLDRFQNNVKWFFILNADLSMCHQHRDGTGIPVEKD